VGETNLGLLSLGDLSPRRRQVVPDRVTFGGVTYLVGENVARYARPVQRMDLLRLADGPELRALCYAAVYRLLGAGEHQATLMVGLPVEVMADRERGLATLRALRGWLVDHHDSIQAACPFLSTSVRIGPLATERGLTPSKGIRIRLAAIVQDNKAQDGNLNRRSN